MKYLLFSVALLTSFSTLAKSSSALECSSLSGSDTKLSVEISRKGIIHLTSTSNFDATCVEIKDVVMDMINSGKFEESQEGLAAIIVQQLKIVPENVALCDNKNVLVIRQISKDSDILMLAGNDLEGDYKCGE